jgi:hypothetical protein
MSASRQQKEESELFLYLPTKAAENDAQEGALKRPW